jgi:hypothetical protein
MLAGAETYIDERSAFQLNALGVRYLLLPRGREPATRADVIESRGNHVLWEVPTSGYVALVDTIRPITTTSPGDTTTKFTRFLYSPALRAGLYPTVAYRGSTAGRPTVEGTERPNGSPGSVRPVDYQPERGLFRVQIDAERRAAVMLKASYHGRWRVLVDGKEASKYMVAPGYPAVTVEPGSHNVEFRYIPVPDYPWLFAVGVLALIALHFLMRRERKTRRPAPPGAVAAPEIGRREENRPEAAARIPEEGERVADEEEISESSPAPAPDPIAEDEPEPEPSEEQPPSGERGSWTEPPGPQSP